MSTERKLVRPFEGLENLEDLAARVRLKVVDHANDLRILEAGESAWFPRRDIAELGLEVVFEWTDAETVEAAKKARIPTNQIEIYLIAEDPFLKERTVVDHWSIAAMRQSHVIAQKRQERERALQNPLSGFDLFVVAVLLDVLPERLLFRPHRKGTILAETQFSVRGEAATGSLKLQPLTAEVRADQKLPISTVLYVHIDGDILQTEDLAGVVDVYVNEQMYNSLEASRDPKRAPILQQFAIDAWCQIVYALRYEIGDAEFEWDGKTGAALRGLYGLAKTLKPLITKEDMVTTIRSKPEQLCALLSGAGRQAGLLMKLVEVEAEEGEEG